MYSYFIFGLVILILYVFFWKPSGFSETQKGIEKMEEESKQWQEQHDEVMLEIREEEERIRKDDQKGMVEKQNSEITDAQMKDYDDEQIKMWEDATRGSNKSK